MRHFFSKSKADKKKKKLEDIRVTWISLVGDPANEKGIVYKSKDKSDTDSVRSLSIVSKSADKHLIYATVYEPDVEDTDFEFASAEEIEKACHRFQSEYRQDMVDTEHDKYPNRTMIVENFIKYGDHPDFPDTKDGAWCVVMKVRDVEIWEKVESGEINGVSMYGDALKTTVEKSSDESAAENNENTMKSKVNKLWAKVFKTNNNSEDEEMDKETKDRLEKIEKAQGELKTENDSLVKKSSDLEKENEELKKNNKTLTEKNEELSGKVEELEKSVKERVTKKRESGEDGEEDVDSDYDDFA